MRKHSRTIGLTSIVTAGLLTLAACGDDSSSNNAGGTTATTAGAATSGATTSAAPKYPPIPDGATIKLGISVPLSGPIAAAGTTAQKAFTEVTLKTFNAAHPDGIDGHKVELVIKDDAGDTTKAVAVANQLVAEQVTAVITASYNPEASAQQLAIWMKSKIPVVTPVYVDDYADVTKWPYLFGTGNVNTQQAEAAAAWLAKHPEIKTVSTITDGIPQMAQLMTDILSAAKKTAPSVQVKEQVTVPPGTVDYSSAVAQLKGSNPDLLLVFTNYGYGPLWQAIQTANWTPKILAGPVFYEGFDAVGKLANDMHIITAHCVDPAGHPPFPKSLTDPMDGYVSIFGSTSVNYILFVTTDNGPLELLKMAIEKHHSIDPDAIKDGLETLGSQKLFGTVDYNYTPTNHFGLTGDYGTSVCNATGFADGPYRIPVKST
jgi:branched-chain amino acid transport system substrate-binding protein